MNRYRIGTISGQWANFKPPIRGGTFLPTKKCGSTDVLRSPPVDIITPPYIPLVRADPLSAAGLNTTHLPDKTSVGAGGDHPCIAESAPDNTEIVEQALEKDLRDYPSLDRDTQEGITRKYRELHAKIQDEGYYECQYWEYGKESLRYTFIFASFLVALRAGWYIASAVLLGLFWVWPVL